MSRTIFPSLQSGETVTLSFDFSSRMTVGQTISTAAMSVELFSGIDAAPAALLSGSPSISGAIVTHKVAPTLPGNVYDVQCAASLATGQVLIMGGYVAVNPRPI